MKLLLTLLLFFPSMLSALSTTFPFLTISGVGGNSAPQLAVSSGGNAAAIWLNASNNPPNLIQFAYFNAATGTWTGVMNIANGSNPLVGIDGFGNALVVWVSQTNQIVASRFNVPAFVFTAPVVLSTGGASNGSPKLAVNNVGTAVVVWLQNGITTLASSVTAVNFIWSTPVVFANNTYPSAFQLDNFNHGIAIFQTVPQNTIQVTRILAP